MNNKKKIIIGVGAFVVCIIAIVAAAIVFNNTQLEFAIIDSNLEWNKEGKYVLELDLSTIEDIDDPTVDNVEKSDFVFSAVTNYIQEGDENVSCELKEILDWNIKSVDKNKLELTFTDANAAEYKNITLYSEKKIINKKYAFYSNIHMDAPDYSINATTQDLHPGAEQAGVALSLDGDVSFAQKPEAGMISLPEGYNDCRVELERVSDSQLFVKLTNLPEVTWGQTLSIDLDKEIFDLPIAGDVAVSVDMVETKINVNKEDILLDEGTVTVKFKIPDGYLFDETKSISFDEEKWDLVSVDASKDVNAVFNYIGKDLWHDIVNEIFGMELSTELGNEVHFEYSLCNALFDLDITFDNVDYNNNTLDFSVVAYNGNFADDISEAAYEIVTSDNLEVINTNSVEKNKISFTASFENVDEAVQVQFAIKDKNCVEATLLRDEVFHEEFITIRNNERAGEDEPVLLYDKEEGSLITSILEKGTGVVRSYGEKEIIKLSKGVLALGVDTLSDIFAIDKKTINDFIEKNLLKPATSKLFNKLGLKVSTGESQEAKMASAINKTLSAVISLREDIENLSQSLASAKNRNIIAEFYNDYDAPIRSMYELLANDNVIDYLSGSEEDRKNVDICNRFIGAVEEAFATDYSHSIDNTALNLGQALISRTKLSKQDGVFYVFMDELKNTYNFGFEVSTYLSEFLTTYYLAYECMTALAIDYDTAKITVDEKSYKGKQNTIIDLGNMYKNVSSTVEKDIQSEIDKEMKRYDDNKELFIVNGKVVSRNIRTVSNEKIPGYVTHTYCFSGTLTDILYSSNGPINAAHLVGKEEKAITDNKGIDSIVSISAADYEKMYKRALSIGKSFYKELVDDGFKFCFDGTIMVRDWRSGRKQQEKLELVNAKKNMDKHMYFYVDSIRFNQTNVDSRGIFSRKEMFASYFISAKIYDILGKNEKIRFKNDNIKAVYYQYTSSLFAGNKHEYSNYPLFFFAANDKAIDSTLWK